MLIALDKALSELGDRMTAAEQAMRPRPAATTPPLRSERRGGAPAVPTGRSSRSASALDGVQAAMRAQARRARRAAGVGRGPQPATASTSPAS